MRLPSIPRSIPHLAALWVAVILLGISSVFALVRVQNNQTVVHNILCTSQRNAQDSLKGSIRFLHEHPNGSADFSRAFILNAIQQDKQRVLALSGLACT